MKGSRRAAEIESRHKRRPIRGSRNALPSVVGAAATKETDSRAGEKVTLARERLEAQRNA